MSAEGRTFLAAWAKAGHISMLVDLTCSRCAEVRVSSSAIAYTFARVSAVCRLRSQDYIDLGRECALRLHGKDGGERNIPVHPRLTEYPDIWRAHTGVSGSAVLFPAFEALNKHSC